MKRFAVSRGDDSFRAVLQALHVPIWELVGRTCLLQLTPGVDSFNCLMPDIVTSSRSSSSLYSGEVAGLTTSSVSARDAVDGNDRYVLSI